MQTNNKLREAAVKCCEIALQWQADEAAGVAGTTDKPHARSAAEAVIDMEFELNAALAAPPRNCDKYPHDEALNIWAAENENERNGCFDEWLYHEATEKEGGNEVNEKPPLGIVPRYIHDEHRAREIIFALLRYLDADKPIPREWLEELFDRVKIKEEGCAK